MEKSKANYAYIGLAIVVIVAAGWLGFGNRDKDDSAALDAGNALAVAAGSDSGTSVLGTEGETNAGSFGTVVAFGDSDIPHGMVAGEGADLSGIGGPMAGIAPIKLYFTREGECEGLVEVTKSIDNTPRIGTAALNTLLLGPTSAQAAAGISTSLPKGARVESLVVDDGTAYVSVNALTRDATGGGCDAALRKSQISKTLLQFPTVRHVEIKIDGELWSRC